MTIKVAVRVIDARTGQIVQSFSDEETRSGTSWNAGGFTGWTVAARTATRRSSTATWAISSTTRPAKIVAIDRSQPLQLRSGRADVLSGHIAAIDGRNVIIDIGSNDGVQVGQQFDIVRLKSLIDPTTHQVLHVNENIGKLQIDTVSPTRRSDT